MGILVGQFYWVFYWVFLLANFTGHFIGYFNWSILLGILIGFFLLVHFAGQFRWPLSAGIFIVGPEKSWARKKLGPGKVGPGRRVCCIDTGYVNWSILLRIFIAQFSWGIELVDYIRYLRVSILLGIVIGQFYWVF